MPKQRHHGIKVLNRAITARKRIRGRIKEYRIGSFCAYCGFEPNENGRYLQQEVLSKILARGRR